MLISTIGFSPPRTSDDASLSLLVPLLRESIDLSDDFTVSTLSVSLMSTLGVLFTSPLGSSITLTSKNDAMSLLASLLSIECNFCGAFIKSARGFLLTSPFGSSSTTSVATSSGCRNFRSSSSAALRAFEAASWSRRMGSKSLRTVGSDIR